MNFENFYITTDKNQWKHSHNYTVLAKLDPKDKIQGKRLPIKKLEIDYF